MNALKEKKKKKRNKKKNKSAKITGEEGDSLLQNATPPMISGGNK